MKISVFYLKQPETQEKPEVTAKKEEKAQEKPAAQRKKHWKGFQSAVDWQEGFKAEKSRYK